MKLINFTFLTDKLIARRVRDRIQWDKRVSKSDLAVKVANGILVLDGTVDSRYKERAAIEVAESTEGVDTVINRISVPTSFRRSDDEIKNILETEVKSMGLEPDEIIAVAAQDGVVFLTGRVFDSRRKARAAGFTWELSGVKDCHNEIQIVDLPNINYHVADIPTATWMALRKVSGADSGRWLL